MVSKGAFDAFLYAPDTPPPTPSPVKKPAQSSSSIEFTKLKEHPCIRLELASDASSPNKRDHVPHGSPESPVKRRRSARLLSTPTMTPSSEKTVFLAPSPPNSPLAETQHTNKKKKRKAARPYADPSLYAHLPQHLADLVYPGLTLLFVGLNPGVMTAQTGFHFANPTNLFWPLLFTSGIIHRPMIAHESALLIPEFNVGITNIVKRPTAEGGELSKQECVDGAGQLVDLVREYKPKAIALTGKGIWDAMFRFLHGRTIKKSDDFHFGWQSEVIEGHEGYRCRIFVTMGTSGRVAAYLPAYKRKVFNDLGDWVNEVRTHEKAMEFESREMKATGIKTEIVESDISKEIEEEEVKPPPEVVLYSDDESPFFRH